MVVTHSIWYTRKEKFGGWSGNLYFEIRHHAMSALISDARGRKEFETAPDCVREGGDG